MKPGGPTLKSNKTLFLIPRKMVSIEPINVILMVFTVVKARQKQKKLQQQPYQQWHTIVP